jgi:putative heme-binding domain-containing protein
VALRRAHACQTCHRLGDEGVGVGPDLTAAANRYTLRDLVENIVDPNKVISDQYENSIIVLSDGSTVIGLGFQRGFASTNA